MTGLDKLAPDVLKALLRYEPDTGLLFWRARPEHMFKAARDAKAWNARYSGREAMTCVVKGYRYGAVFDRGMYAHRAILAMHNGEWPEVSDHVNGDKMDNRLENLRSVRFVENMHNLPTPITNTSGVMGVRFLERQQKWAANIKADGVAIFLGHYDSLHEATIARRAAEKALQFHENHGRQPILRALKAQGGDK